MRSSSEPARSDATSRWRGYRCAGHRVRAAEGGTGDRFLRRRFTRPVCITGGRVPSGADRSRLYRRAEFGDRISLGRGPDLARPGGNLTGFNILSSELIPKRLELLSEMVPQASVIALLVNPDSPSAERLISDTQRAALAKGGAALYR